MLHLRVLNAPEHFGGGVRHRARLRSFEPLHVCLAGRVRSVCILRGAVGGLVEFANESEGMET